MANTPVHSIICGEGVAQKDWRKHHRKRHISTLATGARRRRARTHDHDPKRETGPPAQVQIARPNARKHLEQQRAFRLALFRDASLDRQDLSLHYVVFLQGRGRGRGRGVCVRVRRGRGVGGQRKTLQFCNHFTSFGDPAFGDEESG